MSNDVLLLTSILQTNTDTKVLERAIVKLTGMFTTTGTAAENITLVKSDIERGYRKC